MSPLSEEDVGSFIANGYVKLEEAFSKDLAEGCRALLWKKLNIGPADQSGWKQPVIRLGYLDDLLIVQSANTPKLMAAFDQLLGKGNWDARTNVGDFVIRFPSHVESRDTGWHVDSGFPGPLENDFMSWRINLYSKGRGLLMLFLYSDVGEDDAPTRIALGSHRQVAKILEPYTEQGLSFLELAKLLPEFKTTDIALATGSAGTVYLCHPFLAHAAQAHKGKSPKFMAQPTLHAKNEFRITGGAQGRNPVELAIKRALARQ